MPGTGIPDFSRLAAAIADPHLRPRTSHDKVLVPVVLRQWDVESLEGLDAEAEAARERTITYIAHVDRVGKRIAERREQKLATASA